MLRKNQKRFDQVRENFAQHVATKTVYTAGDSEITVIDWKRPASGAYAMRFVLDRNNLFVSGDVCDAAFSLTEKADIAKLAKYDATYLYGKMSCIDDLDRGVAFDGKFASEEVRDWYSSVTEYCDKNDDLEDVYQALLEAAEECSSLTQWRHALSVVDSRNCIGQFDADWYESIPNFGSSYGLEIISIHLGLRMAYQQLKA